MKLSSLVKIENCSFIISIYNLYIQYLKKNEILSLFLWITHILWPLPASPISNPLIIYLWYSWNTCYKYKFLGLTAHASSEDRVLGICSFHNIPGDFYALKVLRTTRTARLAFFQHECFQLLQESSFAFFAGCLTQAGICSPWSLVIQRQRADSSNLISMWQEPSEKLDA